MGPLANGGVEGTGLELAELLCVLGRLHAARGEGRAAARCLEEASALVAASELRPEAALSRALASLASDSGAVADQSDGGRTS